MSILSVMCTNSTSPQLSARIATGLMIMEWHYSIANTMQMLPWKSALLIIFLCGIINIPGHRCWRAARTAVNIKNVHNLKDKQTYLKAKTLRNGLKYLILPNKCQANAFDTYLEILSGSADERNNERGMAHFFEHIAYMGNPAMNSLARETGLRTNAFTDYHHTVYYASYNPTSKSHNFTSPLSSTMHALATVLAAPIRAARLHAERAAVLSEMSQVNTLSHRTEMQIINDLHAENMLSVRSPIGSEDDMWLWSVADMERYQRRAYRPDNSVLYVVGDVDVEEVERSIDKSFGSMNSNRHSIDESHPPPQAASMRHLHRHFPPVTHNWACTPHKARHVLSRYGSCGGKVGGACQQSELINQLSGKTPFSFNDSTVVISSETSEDRLGALAALPSPRVHRYPGLQRMTINILAKRPIDPILTPQDLRREVIYRLIINALQQRLSVNCRDSDVSLESAGVWQQDVPREGCAVTGLRVTCQPQLWRQALRSAVRELRKICIRGLSTSEIVRHKRSLAAEMDQWFAGRKSRTNQELAEELMHSEACGHFVFGEAYKHTAVQRMLKPRARRLYPSSIVRPISKVLKGIAFLMGIRSSAPLNSRVISITPEEVRATAIDIFEHLCRPNAHTGVMPSAVSAIVPDSYKGNDSITEDKLADELLQLMREEPSSHERDKEIVVPRRFSSQPLTAKLTCGWLPKCLFSQWLRLPKKYQNLPDLGTRFWPKEAAWYQTVFPNRMKFNALSTTGIGDSGHASIRVDINGGRLLEGTYSVPIGAVLLGAKTLQEGGAAGGISRKQMELFCADHHVEVEVRAEAETVVIEVKALGCEAPRGGGLSSFEAALQVLHSVLSSFVWEQDAYDRAVMEVLRQSGEESRDLEVACQACIQADLFANDERLLTPDEGHMAKLSLRTIEKTMRSLLVPSNMQVSIAADLPPQAIALLGNKYLGTISGNDTEKWQLAAERARPLPPTSFPLPSGGTPRILKFPDTVNRTLGYLVGTVPGLSSSKSSDEVLKDRLAFMIVTELANQQLFQVVREEKQLVYDAALRLHPLTKSGREWFVVSLATHRLDKVKDALAASMSALRALGPEINSHDVSLARESVKTTLLRDARKGSFWTAWISSGVQTDAASAKLTSSISNALATLENITLSDVQNAITQLGLEKPLSSYIGTTEI